MPRGELLGSLEHIVLIALVRLGANAYGVTVRREIEQRTGRDLSIGAVYATLERLAKYISARPWASHGGHARAREATFASTPKAACAACDAGRECSSADGPWLKIG